MSIENGGDEKVGSHLNSVINSLSLQVCFKQPLSSLRELCLKFDPYQTALQ